MPPKAWHGGNEPPPYGLQGPTVIELPGGGRVILADAQQIQTRRFWDLYKPNLVVNAVGGHHEGFYYLPETHRGSFYIS